MKNKYIKTGANLIAASAFLFASSAELTAQTTTTYSYTGSVQTFTVPSGVTSIKIKAYGAEGGSAGNNVAFYGSTGAGMGGNGGYATGDLAVTPGDVIYIYVGGKGNSGASGGYNGGGLGISTESSTTATGGGASDVRVGGTALSNRVIVAGGGGGAEWSGYQREAGAGGGTTGGVGFGDAPNNSGQGGTQSAGGAGGNDYCGYGSNAGSLGNGGGSKGYHSGGGGGGYYGGGSGGCDGHGGGGSSYIGGVSNGSTSTGGRTGNGEIVISYVSCPQPSISVPSSITTNAGSNCDASVSYTATESTGAAMTYTFSGATTGSGSGTGTGSTFNKGITTISISASNSCGSQTKSFTVTVNDATAPSAPTLSDATGECSVTVTAPTATDNCSGTITGTTTDPTVYSAQGNYTITWSFDDGNGNISTSTQNVIVKDVTAPAAPTLSDATGECSATVTAPAANDNCSGTITGTTTDPTSYSAQGSYTVTWSFDDGNGNVSSSVQNVIVKDVTAPTVTCKNKTLTLSSGSATLTVADVLDASSDNCGISGYALSKTAWSCSDNGTSSVTLTVTDVGGNTATCTADVTVSVITSASAGPDRIVYYGAPSAYSCVTLTASGSGGSNYSYSWGTGATTQSVTVCPSSTTTYSVTVTDDQGCSATGSAKVCSFDVRCSSGKSGNMNKVLVCHKTGSKKNPTNQLCISPDDVADHLNDHGDYLGTCGTTYSCGSAPAPMNDQMITGYSVGTNANFTVFPNPFQTNATIMFSVPKDQNVTIELFNMNGQKLSTLFNGFTAANHAVALNFDGSSYTNTQMLVKMTTESGLVITKPIVSIR